MFCSKDYGARSRRTSSVFKIHGCSGRKLASSSLGHIIEGCFYCHLWSRETEEVTDCYQYSGYDEGISMRR
jgi:hypothetical protein